MKKNLGLALAGLFLVAIGVLSYSARLGLEPGKAEILSILLTRQNTVILDDVIDEDSTGAVVTQAKRLDNQSDAPIYLFLRSPGGSIQAGLDMFESLKGLNRPVDTVTAFAASMAFQTVQQMRNRYVLQSGVLMSHHAVGQFQGEFGGRHPSQVDNRKAFWEARVGDLDLHTVVRTKGKQTLESYQTAYENELWLTGSEAVENGYADNVVVVSCDISLSGVITKHVQFFGLPISFDIDACPLNPTPKNIKIDVPTNKGTMTLNAFVAAGGGFGAACWQEISTNPNKVCSEPLTLTPEQVLNADQVFKSHYTNIRSKVRPYTF